MRGNLGQLLKQAQQLQEQMRQAQEALERLEVTGEAGGGMVRITMTGRYEVRRVVIDSALPLDEREMLEDLVAAAMNDAVRKVSATLQDRFAGFAGGLGLPAGMKLPF